MIAQNINQMQWYILVCVSPVSPLSDINNTHVLSTSSIVNVSFGQRPVTYNVSLLRSVQQSLIIRCNKQYDWFAIDEESEFNFVSWRTLKPEFWKVNDVVQMKCFIQIRFENKQTWPCSGKHWRKVLYFSFWDGNFHYPILKVFF